MMIYNRIICFVLFCLCTNKSISQSFDNKELFLGFTAGMSVDQYHKRLYSIAKVRNLKIMEGTATANGVFPLSFAYKEFKYPDPNFTWEEHKYAYGVAHFDQFNRLFKITLSTSILSYEPLRTQGTWWGSITGKDDKEFNKQLKIAETKRNRFILNAVSIYKEAISSKYGLPNYNEGNACWMFGQKKIKIYTTDDDVILEYQYIPKKKTGSLKDDL